MTVKENESLPVQIKANRDGFILVPDPTASFESILAHIGQYLDESHDFFRRSEMILDLRSAPLRTDEISILYGLLMDRAGVKLVQVRLGDELNFVVDGGSAHAHASSRPSAQPHCREAAPIVIRSTCRSGAQIVSPSDCLILGDVNPGAEVIAIGDIVVFGNLRGMAHAGAQGDRSARIWALSIEPNQLRIADLVAIPPRGNKPTPKRFEIAEIQKGAIEVITM